MLYIFETIQYLTNAKTYKKMGCASVKEKLESQIMMLKLQRVDIIQEREERLKELEKLTGETMKRRPIPDYLIREEVSNDKQANNNGGETPDEGNEAHQNKKPLPQKKGKEENLKKDNDSESRSKSEESGSDEESGSGSGSGSDSGSDSKSESESED